MVIWLVVGVVGACVAASVWLNMRRGRRLRRRFGPEYARVLAQQGDREVTELELKQRLRRRQDLPIRPLPDEVRERYTQWLRAIEAGFDADPAESLAEADALVIEIMRARGYPGESFAQMVADVSVADPESTQEYRAGYTLAVPDDSQRAPSREQLRTALMHYERLVERLVGDGGAFVETPRGGSGATDSAAPGRDDA
jgi:hypothetical protein